MYFDTLLMSFGTVMIVWFCYGLLLQKDTLMCFLVFLLSNVDQTMEVFIQLTVFGSVLA